MPGGNSNQIKCPACDAAYHWSVGIAGRRVRCSRCGVEMRMPAAPGDRVEILTPGRTAGSNRLPPGAVSITENATEEPAPTEAQTRVDTTILPGADVGTNESAGYELALENEVSPAAPPPAVNVAIVPEARVSTPGRCPNCGSKLKAEVVLCLNCGYHVREGAKIETKILASEAEAIDGGSGTEKQDDAISKRDADLGVLSGGSLERKHREARDANRDYMFREIYLPLFILAMGIVVILFTAACVMPIVTASPAAPTGTGLTLPAGFPSVPGISPATPALASTAPAVAPPAIQRGHALAWQGAQIALQFPFLFAGIFLIAHLYGTDFGALATGVLKLLALAVAANALAFFIESLLLSLTDGLGGPLLFLVDYSISFGAFWALTALLFQMEFRQARFLYFFTILMPVLVLVGIKFLM